MKLDIGEEGRVRITRAFKDSVWYARRIGACFDVIGDDDKHVRLYVDVDGDGVDTLVAIAHGDYEIVSGILSIEEVRDLKPSFDEWWKEVYFILRSIGYNIKSVQSLYKTDWKETYDEGLSPDDAVYEHETRER